MVSKLLLAVQENFFLARELAAGQAVCERLGSLYYRIRGGIGFNKTPSEYGAFPLDPYSHTPGHIGAQQPGMTGQVKEEVLARYGELGVRVSAGGVQFDPGLLRAQEFITAPQQFRFRGVDDQWSELTVPAQGLAFTWCQVPLVYRLDDAAGPVVRVHLDDGEQRVLPDLELPAELAEEVFRRSGRVSRIELVLARDLLFPG
jgi:hypothetical protein